MASVAMSQEMEAEVLLATLGHRTKNLVWNQV